MLPSPPPPPGWGPLSSSIKFWSLKSLYGAFEGKIYENYRKTSPEQVLNKFRNSIEQVSKIFNTLAHKFRTSYEQVPKQFWNSSEAVSNTVLNKYWNSHEQVMNKCLTGWVVYKLFPGFFGRLHGCFLGGFNLIFGEFPVSFSGRIFGQRST